jgi:2-polyprenyl-3-methyl-5-hydroxy-6-metoxy-1,4-benzoquinol methylase
MLTLPQSLAEQEYMTLLHQVLVWRFLSRLNDCLLDECGLLPPDVEPLEDSQVLDLACGTGAWVRQLARRNYLMDVIGIDGCKHTINLAQGYSGAIPNAHFMHIALNELDDFPDHSFDLVHLSLIAPLVDVQGWPALLAEVWRICRPGGYIIWREAPCPKTNSAHWATMTSLLTQGLRNAGKSTQVTHLMPGLLEHGHLKKAPWHQVRRSETVLDISSGTRVHQRVYRELLDVIDVLPTYLKLKLPPGESEQDLSKLANHVNIDLVEKHFTGKWPLITVVGEKPLP